MIDPVEEVRHLAVESGNVGGPDWRWFVAERQRTVAGAEIASWQGEANHFEAAIPPVVRLRNNRGVIGVKRIDADCAQIRLFIGNRRDVLRSLSLPEP